MKFYVNHKDIANGVKYSGRNCPVARALQRRLGKTNGIEEVQSGYIYAYVYRKTDSGELEEFGFEYPEYVKDAIMQYDALGVMQPFVGEVDLGKFSLPESH